MIVVTTLGCPSGSHPRCSHEASVGLATTRQPPACLAPLRGVRHPRGCTVASPASASGQWPMMSPHQGLCLVPAVPHHVLGSLSWDVRPPRRKQLGLSHARPELSSTSRFPSNPIPTPSASPPPSQVGPHLPVFLSRLTLPPGACPQPRRGKSNVQHCVGPAQGHGRGHGQAPLSARACLSDSAPTTALGGRCCRDCGF